MFDLEEYHASSWNAHFEKGNLFSDCALLTGKRISGELNLDHTMALKGSVRSLETDLIETGYIAEDFKEEALSDHKGLLSRITLH